MQKYADLENNDCIVVKMGSLQTVGSISIQISKSLWLQTSSLRSHCHSSVQRGWGDIQNVFYGSVCSWNHLVMMLQMEWSSKTSTIYAANSEKCEGEETVQRRKPWSIAIILLPSTKYTRAYTSSVAPFHTWRSWALSSNGFNSSWGFRDYIYKLQASSYFLE